MSDADAARELLRDFFTRLIEHVEEVTDGLTGEVALYRPTPEANTIAWLVWHSARIQDAQLCDIAGTEQVWFREGWVDRFALDLPRDAHGYGHTAEEVAKVRAPADLLAGYYRAVHRESLQYVASVSPDELARIVDRNWNPPVTAGARLVSIIDDAAQHLGQAAYLRGIAP
ncbi:mycothiol transferase [Mycobacterium sp. pV006]|uniref:mycothiol transferase n=1 Tax=Mycobacterium sp. pV006 TaxID=3238983 RepID=UPI00351BC465